MEDDVSQSQSSVRSSSSSSSFFGEDDDDDDFVKSILGLKSSDKDKKGSTGIPTPIATATASTTTTKTAESPVISKEPEQRIPEVKQPRYNPFNYDSTSLAGLGFDLQVEKPALSTLDKQGIADSKRAAELREQIKADELEVAADLEKKQKFEQEVRSSLGDRALKSSHYLKWVTRQYSEESGLDSLKSLHLLRYKPKRGDLESDLQGFENPLYTRFVTGSKGDKFKSLASSLKLKITLFHFDRLIIQQIDNSITKSVFQEQQNTQDLRKSLAVQNKSSNFINKIVSETAFEQFLEDCGLDTDMLFKAMEHSQESVHKIDPMEDMPPVSIVVQKIAIGITLYFDSIRAIVVHKFLTFDDPYPRGKMKPVLKMFVAKFRFLLALILLLLSDSKVHNNSDIQVQNGIEPIARLSQLFDQLIIAYFKVTNKFEPSGPSNSIDSTSLCVWVDDHYERWFHNKCAFLKPLKCLANQHLSKLSTDIVNRLLLFSAMKDIDGEEPLIPDEDMFYKFETEMTMIRYLRLLSVKPLTAKAVNYRDDVMYFMNLKARFMMIEQLIHSYIHHFKHMNDLSYVLYDFYRHDITDATFKMHKYRMIPHILSTYLTKIRQNHFVNFDVSANPILGEIMVLTGNLIFRLDRELEINALDLI